MFLSFFFPYVLDRGGTVADGRQYHLFIMSKEKKQVIQPMESVGYSDKPAKSGSSEHGLTKRQLRYIMNLLASPERSMAANARDAGLANAPSKDATRVLIGRLGPVFAEKNIDENEIAQVFKDALGATKLQRVGKNLYEDVPDHKTRIDAAKEILNVSGYKTVKEEDGSDINRVNQVFINMNFNELERAEKTLEILQEVSPSEKEEE